MNKINGFIDKYKIQIMVIISIIIITLLGFNIYKSNHKIDTLQNNPVITKENVKETVQQSNIKLNDDDAADITHKINTNANKEIYHNYTLSDDEADKKADEIKKEKKYDFTLKEQNENNVGNNKIYDNKYYLIQQERKHAIGAGMAVIDNKPTASLSYRNRRITYSIYYNNDKKVGAGVSYELARW